MKKLVIFSVCICFLSFAVQAQQVNNSKNAQKIEPVQQEEVPAAVVEAFHRDFPNVKTTQWQILPKSQINNLDYVINLKFGDIDPNEGPYDFYTVQMYGKGINAEATYNTDGKLVASQELVKDAALPLAVSQSIVKDYPGYTVTKDKKRIKNMDETFYKIKLAKNGKHETVYMDGAGNRVDKSSV